VSRRRIVFGGRRAGWAGRLARWDRHLLRWSVARRTPANNRALTLLSQAANNGKTWYLTAAVLAATGKRRQRTAAGAGLLALGMASGVVNGPLKFAWQRDRPAADLLGASGALLPLPRTYSFPSGHSASAAAFATAVSLSYPPIAPLVVPVAAAVAYSRVHTGVHYPSDVAVGCAIGVAAGVTAAQLAGRMRHVAVKPCDAPSVPMTMPAKAVLLHSPGSGAASQLDAARQALAGAGIWLTRDFEVTEVDALRDAIRDAGDDPPLVVAAGGDGTVGCAANAIAGTRAVLAIMPLGTSNDVARSLGIVPDVDDAVAAIADGEVVAVDVGRVELADGMQRVFVNAATAGLNVAFAKIATTHTMRDRFGGLTYPASAALALRRYTPFRCTVEHDGERRDLELVHLSISNATVFGGVLGMRVPGADIADGLLDVIAIERLTLPRLGLALGGTIVGRHKPVRRVHSMQVRSVSLSAAGGQQVAADGEVIGELPARFAVERHALRVVVPRRG
jgi:YegS/Rv2252/BmrU family lipid kinase